MDLNLSFKTISLPLDNIHELFYLKKMCYETLDDNLLADIGKLRHLVWQDDGMDMSNSLEEQVWIESYDYKAHHWAIYHDKKIVASARLTLHDDLAHLPEADLYQSLTREYHLPVASFNRLVVDPEYRGFKLSSYLDRLRIESAIKLGAKSVALDCPEYRINSLKRKGFLQMSPLVSGVKCPSKKWAVMCKLLHS